jgi:hypothetical protein
MIRKWNINTSIGVLASYQIEKGTKLQFEPQYRYQLMSTYKKRYSIAENIYHWGIKLGVVKDF